MCHNGAGDGSNEKADLSYNKTLTNSSVQQDFIVANNEYISYFFYTFL